MLRAIAPHIEEHFHTGDGGAGEIAVDPLGFLAGMRYTCLRSVCSRFGPCVVTAPRRWRITSRRITTS